MEGAGELHRPGGGGGGGGEGQVVQGVVAVVGGGGVEHVVLDAVPGESAFRAAAPVHVQAPLGLGEDRIRGEGDVAQGSFEDLRGGVLEVPAPEDDVPARRQGVGQVRAPGGGPGRVTDPELDRPVALVAASIGGEGQGDGLPVRPGGGGEAQAGDRIVPVLFGGVVEGEVSQFGAVEAPFVVAVEVIEEGAVGGFEGAVGLEGDIAEGGAVRMVLVVAPQILPVDGDHLPGPHGVGEGGSGGGSDPDLQIPAVGPVFAVGGEAHGHGAPSGGRGRLEAQLREGIVPVPAGTTPEVTAFQGGPGEAPLLAPVVVVVHRPCGGAQTAVGLEGHIAQGIVRVGAVLEELLEVLAAELDGPARPHLIDDRPAAEIGGPRRHGQEPRRQQGGRRPNAQTGASRSSHVILLR